MEKAAEYRRRAEHCRALADTHQGEQRQQCLTMASQWDMLAAQRVELLDRHPELSVEPAPPPASPPSG